MREVLDGGRVGLGVVDFDGCSWFLMSATSLRLARSFPQDLDEGWVFFLTLTGPILGGVIPVSSPSEV